MVAGGQDCADRQPAPPIRPRCRGPPPERCPFPSVAPAPAAAASAQTVAFSYKRMQACCRPRRGVLMKILLAEDDAPSRQALESLLQGWGYEVVAVGDGAAAWQVLQQDAAPRMALLD